MNTWQVAQQLQWKLAIATWPDSPAEIVFGNVLVSEDAPERALLSLRPPYALIGVRDARDDDDAPGAKLQDFEVTVVVQIPGDETGQNAMLGANRSGGQGSSLGKGLLQVEEVIDSVLNFEDQQSGIRLRLKKKSSAVGKFKPELGSLAARAYTVEARCSSNRSYAPGLRLTGSALGGGQYRLNWTAPVPRFDFTATTPEGDTVSARQVVVRKAGASPPANVSDGTAVNVGPLIATYTDTPGVGTFSWAVFPQYDEWADATTLRTAAAVTLANKVVT